MPGVKISSLPISSLASVDIIPAARGGATIGILGGELLNKFANLGTRIDNLSSNSIFVNNSPTIDLRFNSFSRRLSADLASTLDLRSREVILPLRIETSPGIICPFAGQEAPEGWLVCNGSVGLPNGIGTFQGKTADFSRLYSILGTTYGTTPGTLPDLRGYFVRGFGQAGVVGTHSDGTVSGNFGQRQQDAFQGHKHGLYDPRHTHLLTDPGHSHSLTDPGHQHTSDGLRPSGNYGAGGTIEMRGSAPANDRSVDNATTGITIGSQTTGITLSSSPTNVRVLSATGDTATSGAGDSNGPGGATPRVADETRPKNVALLYCIKY